MTDDFPAAMAQAERVVAGLRAQQAALLRRRDSVQFSWGGVLGRGSAFALLFAAIAAAIAKNSSYYVPAVCLAVLAGACLGYPAERAAVAERQAKLAREAAALDRQLNVEELQTSTEEDFFSRLVSINFRYIEQYYLQTREQADKSFVLSATVATLGFATVVAGVVLMYNGRTEPAYVTTASGVITQTVSAVFFYLYNRTLLKMRDYHKKLVLTQNVSLALKISDGLPTDLKAQAQFKLVERLSENVNALLVADDDATTRGAVTDVPTRGHLASEH